MLDIVEADLIQVSTLPQTCGYNSVGLSFEVLMWSLVLQCVVGTAIAWLLARLNNIQAYAKTPVDGLVTSALHYDPPADIGVRIMPVRQFKFGTFYFSFFWFGIN